MILNGELVGSITKLSSVTVEDSEFILSLRLDDNLSKYLNKVDNDVEKQNQWIRKQQADEGDYYFLIQSLSTNKPLGTISLYNIINNQGEFGRWISIGNSLENLESVILLHDFGFKYLGLNRIYSKTVLENNKVINFHKRFGATILEDLDKQENSGFILQNAEVLKQNYINIREHNIKIISCLISN